MKRGVTSSEFWLSLMSTVFGAIVASGVASNNVVVQVAGIAASVLSALGYTRERSRLKASAGAQ